VLSADADFQVGLRGPSALGAHPNELADAVPIQRLERIARQDLVPQVIGQERARVIPAEAERHLRQVVRAEREEVGLLRDGASRQRGTWDFDHRPSQDIDAVAALVKDGLDRLLDALLLMRKFGLRADQRHHDFGMHVHAVGLHVERGFDDGARLHLSDRRDRHAQPAAAVAKHRIELLERRHLRLNALKRLADVLGEALQALLTVRQELV
jgi:hypothetical protein